MLILTVYKSNGVTIIIQISCIIINSDNNVSKTMEIINMTFNFLLIF